MTSGVNEDFLRDVLAWSSDLISPSIVVGDYNDHPSQSKAMATSETAWKDWKKQGTSQPLSRKMEHQQ